MIKTLCSAVTLLVLLFGYIPQASAQGPVMGPPKTLRKVIPYKPLREADVMWSKRIWRTIDLREKFNHPLYYPEAPTAERISLFDLIKSELTMPVPVLHAFGNPVFDDQFQVPLTPTEIKAIFVQWDSVHQTEDPSNPGTMLPDPIKKELNSPDIKEFWMKEDWFLDKQYSVLDVRILGLCPLKEKTTESGEVEGYSPLFWIYYPEWRQTFASVDVFNPKNNFQWLSFEDVFTKRMFQSYIHKESNVMDRSIQSYTTGLDALLESDRIKDEIFTKEHDLWHF